MKPIVRKRLVVITCLNFIVEAERYIVCELIREKMYSMLLNQSLNGTVFNKMASNANTPITVKATATAVVSDRLEV